MDCDAGCDEPDAKALVDVCGRANAGATAFGLKVRVDSTPGRSDSCEELSILYVCLVSKETGTSMMVVKACNVEC